MTRALTLEEFIDANAVDTQVVRRGVSQGMIVVFKMDPTSLSQATIERLQRIWKMTTDHTPFEGVRCLVLPKDAIIETIYSE